MPSPQNEQPVQKSSSRFFIGLFSVLGAVFFLLFMGLGIWQVERLQWKLDLIERVDARVHAEPVAAPGRDDWANVNQKDDEYRRVKLTGTYLNDKEILVHALTERGAGYWVLTPMRSPDGALTFINRGFVRMIRRVTTGTRAMSQPLRRNSIWVGSRPISSMPMQIPLPERCQSAV